MSDNVIVVGDDEDGWNVEVTMSGQTVVFACLDKEAANELQDMISSCSWFQIENR